MTQITTCKLMDVENLNERYSRIKIHAPEIALDAGPGQFVNIQVNENNNNDPLLKRPFSIHQVNQDLGMIELLIKVVGRGTANLQKITGMRELEVVGPLGHGFKLQKTGKALLIAGGIGVAPLKELGKQLVARGIQITLLFGVTDESDLILSSVIEELHPKIIMVNPGQTGHRKGLVTELLAEEVIEEYEQIYTCGPEPMLKAIQQCLGGHNAKTQFSVEERMGCGVGLCYSCVCKVRKSEDKTDWEYGRVCTCGPVFLGNEVIFDE